jgi:hypothetical protein
MYIALLQVNVSELFFFDEKAAAQLFIYQEEEEEEEEVGTTVRRHTQHERNSFGRSGRSQNRKEQRHSNQARGVCLSVFWCDCVLPDATAPSHQRQCERTWSSDSCWKKKLRGKISDVKLALLCSGYRQSRK